MNKHSTIACETRGRSNRRSEVLNVKYIHIHIHYFIEQHITRTAAAAVHEENITISRKFNLHIQFFGYLKYISGIFPIFTYVCLCVATFF